MTFNALEYVKELSLAGLLEDQTGEPTEKHKQTNLLLNCTEEVEQAFAPLFCQIFSLIESERRQGATAQGRRYYAPDPAKYIPAIKTLVLNAVQINQYDYQNLHLSISRDRNVYKRTSRYTLRNISYGVMITVFDCMVSNGLLEIQRVGFQNRQTGESERTRYHGSPALFDAVATFVGGAPIDLRTDYALALRPVELIRLKDTKGRTAEYRESVFTEQARHNLSIINNLLLSTELGLDLPEDEMQEMLSELRRKNEANTGSDSVYFLDLSSVMLHRTFNDGMFSKGGRFYGGWWQGIPKDYRQAITINGKPTVELDYSAIHPAMLYAEQGLELGDIDPYTVDERVSRKFGKIAFNALLNAKAVPTKVPDGFPVNQISWMSFLALMVQRHEPIVNRFCTGYGLDLQFKDSEIAEAVMLHFANQGIPCLPVHDSFIVDADYELELRIMMSSLFKDKVGCPINIK